MSDKIIELLDEDNQPQRFELIEVIECDDKEYALLVPLAGEKDEAIVCELEDMGDEILATPVEDPELIEKIERLYNDAF